MDTEMYGKLGLSFHPKMLLFSALSYVECCLAYEADSPLVKVLTCSLCKYIFSAHIKM